MNLARRSSRPTVRMTSGRRYFSVLAMVFLCGSPCHFTTRPATAAVRPRLLRMISNHERPVRSEEAPIVDLVEPLGEPRQVLAQRQAGAIDHRRLGVVV